MAMGIEMSLTHRRFNPLTREWVLVCGDRTARPWQGAEEAIVADNLPSYVDDCYLCPGNQRASGDVNPNYQTTYVFTNDFSALKPSESLPKLKTTDLFQQQAATGICRVVCFSPQHNLTLANMSIEAITSVLNIWQQQFIELSADYQWVQIFENKGAIMGCSNPHPHGQIWASNFLPNEMVKEQQAQQLYYKEQQRKLLLDYAEQELQHRDRIVEENEYWLVVVPYWAVWPFETLLLPKISIANWASITTEQIESLAAILKTFLGRYDKLFSVSFPYSMGWHCAPLHEGTDDVWQLHAHFYPPLLRSATVKKFMVGYEMLAEPQRDFTPEQAAKLLREVN